MPDFLDAERLAQISLVVIVGLFAIGIVVMQVVKAIVTKVLYLAVIAIAALSVYAQRDQLQECQATCSCTLFGQEVAVPDNPACGPDATGASLRESITSPITNAGVGAGAAVIEVIYEMVEELITGE